MKNLGTRVKVGDELLGEESLWTLLDAEELREVREFAKERGLDEL